ncbi:MAG: hypothetical protein M1833_005587 [Piccolia ochrophora]|nr:MAG: hypothetical protein M1833_005587 [Piccolia ochrophora]
MAPSVPSTKELSTLKLTVSTTSTLISQFQSSLTANATDKPQSIENASTPPSTADPAPPHDPIPLIHTSATLVKAHTTKLSLLILNRPFTPSALSTVLRELSTGALPLLLTAVEACDPSVFTHLFHKELRACTQRLLQDLASLVGEIPLDVASASKASGSASGEGSTLPTTGLVWSACDALTTLASQGISGLLVRKAQEYRDLLADAIAELDEWSKEESEAADDDDDVEDSEKEDDPISDNATDNVLAFGADSGPPPESIRPLLKTSLTRLTFIKHLYTAIIKHRLRSIPSPQSHVSATISSTPPFVTTVDKAMRSLCEIPEETDELANAFYEHDAETADTLLKHCVSLAQDAAKTLHDGWQGAAEASSKDAFRAWVEMWTRLVGNADVLKEG